MFTHSTCPLLRLQGDAGCGGPPRRGPAATAGGPTRCGPSSSRRSTLPGAVAAARARTRSTASPRVRVPASTSSRLLAIPREVQVGVHEPGQHARPAAGRSPRPARPRARPAACTSAFRRRPRRRSGPARAATADATVPRASMVRTVPFTSTSVRSTFTPPPSPAGERSRWGAEVQRVVDAGRRTEGVRAYYPQGMTMAGQATRPASAASRDRDDLRRLPLRAGRSGGPSRSIRGAPPPMARLQPSGHGFRGLGRAAPSGKKTSD